MQDYDVGKLLFSVRLNKQVLAAQKMIVWVLIVFDPRTPFTNIPRTQVKNPLLPSKRSTIELMHFGSNQVIRKTKYVGSKQKAFQNNCVMRQISL